MTKNDKDTGMRIFAALFLVLLVLFTGINLVGNGAEIWEDMVEMSWGWDTLQANFKSVEESMGEELVGRHRVIDLYGAMELAMGKKEDDCFDTMLDKNGFLHNGNFWVGYGDDTKDMAIRTKALEQHFVEKDIKFGVILYPMNLPQEDARYYGLPYQSANHQVDTFSSWIRYYNIPTLDLRDNWKKAGLTQEEAFFRTDHHWTPLAAFYGYQEILKWMERTHGAEIQNMEALCDLSQYNMETYEDFMFGSKGRVVGQYFAGGPEDFTLIYPKEPGSYTLKEGEVDSFNYHKGTFTEALLDIHYPLESYEDMYLGHAENVYLHSGTTEYVSLTNLNSPSEDKILLLRDSYSSPVGAFLGQSFERVDMLWIQRYSNDELMDFLEENAYNYDYVFLALYPENMSSINFRFGEDAYEK